jgi:hypothetical protein
MPFGGLAVPSHAVAVRQLMQAHQDQQDAEHEAGQAAQQQELLERCEVQAGSSFPVVVREGQETTQVPW